MTCLATASIACNTAHGQKPKQPGVFYWVNPPKNRSKLTPKTHPDLTAVKHLSLGE